jgi:tRNA-Thr(GGU) m(6)t(6)A37 methyltransferase TsaA
VYKQAALTGVAFLLNPVYLNVVNKVTGTKTTGADASPSDQDYQFRPIGWIESPYKEKFGTPRQPGLVDAPIGAVLLRDDLNADALDGLKDYSHAWLVFVFHANRSFKTGRPFEKTKVHPPRLQGAAVGVFATRSPHRPNPIGLSLVKIERVEERRLYIRGLDLIEGTPVLDIKPYLPTVEAPLDAYEGWSANLAPSQFEVEWSLEALGQLSAAAETNADVATSGSANLDHFKNSIEQILRLDPRPVAYRGTAENPDPYMSTYGFRFQNWNIVFEMISMNIGSENNGSVDNGSGRLAPTRVARILRLENWPASGAVRTR